jgi:hypothetical protein
VSGKEAVAGLPPSVPSSAQCFSGSDHRTQTLRAAHPADAPLAPVGRDRLTRYCRRAGIDLSCHRLRHTFGRHMTDAGMPVTSIQKLLGHKRLNTTMIYARAHDHTVAEDYYIAMAKIEKCLDPNAEQAPVAKVDDAGEPVSIDERTRLLALVDQLAEPQLSLEARLVLVEQMRCVLNHTENLATANTPQQMAMDTAA